MTSQTRPSLRKVTSSAYRIALATGIAAAFALRLYRLGAESLWYDETVSAYLARQSFSAMLAHTAVDIHPPGYYALLHLWAGITHPFGGPALEFLLAFPSVVFGVLGIALLVPFGRMVLGDQIALAAVWIAAINPFLIWYGQEVRMYTVAGALALLCLLAALQFVRMSTPASTEPVPVTYDTTTRSRPTLPAWIWLSVYVVAGAAAMYVLYYSAFALLAINIAVCVTLAIEARRKVRVGPALFAWFGAQLGVLVLFSAWLPLFVRQVLQPPVPPWRVPWQSIDAFFGDIGAALASYVVGQSIPAAQVWLWAAITVLVFIAYYDYAKDSSAPMSTPSSLRIWLPVYVLAPPVFIFLINALVVPVFHVRYLSVVAPAFSLIIAAALWRLYNTRRILFAFLCMAILLGSAYSMSRFWRNSDYRSDDHRAAVALLAQRWRPGDVILANAGWVYTAIDTYWPSSLHTAYDALPPEPVVWTRLTDAEAILETLPGPIGVMTGFIDGDASLGWGSEYADFYAISASETEGALNLIEHKHPRLWHYRLYDTVNDPNGLIRRWLSTYSDLLSKTAFAGTGNLTLEEYAGARAAELTIAGTDTRQQFEDLLDIAEAGVPGEARAGTVLYVPVRWQSLPGYSPSQRLAASLRLVDADGTLWAQHDESIPDLTRYAVDGSGRDQILALPIPVSTPPGEYDVRVVVYRADDLAPLRTGPADSPAFETTLGAVRVQLPEEVPATMPSRTTFDYLELMEAGVPETELVPGRPMHLDLVWRPVQSTYQDAYLACVSLVDGAGTIVPLGEDALGPAHYPSSMWAAGVPVRDQVDLALPEELAQGEYSVRLQVLRESDGLLIPARRFRWLPFSRDSFDVGTVLVGAQTP